MLSNTLLSNGSHYQILAISFAPFFVTQGCFQSHIATATAQQIQMNSAGTFWHEGCTNPIAFIAKCVRGGKKEGALY